MTGAAQTSSTPSIFRRPWRVRWAASIAPPASGKVCTVKPRGCSDATSGGTLAAWANEASDDLEPDIKECNQAAKPEPLKCVTIVFIDARGDDRPVALHAFTRLPQLNH